MRIQAADSSTAFSGAGIGSAQRLFGLAANGLRNARSEKGTRHDPLDEAIAAAIASRKLIGPLQTALRAHAETLEPGIERDYVKYQVDLVALQLNRAADIAERRRDHLAAIVTPEEIEAELARCEESDAYWFEWYAWSVDPREDAPLSITPFGLFDYQHTALDWINDLVFLRRRHGVVEKARDMGATWLFCLWAVKHWRFRPNFSVLLGSLNQDKVDLIGSVDTIFEKMRVQLRLMPEWMRPAGFSIDKHAPFLRIINPENGALLKGEAPTPNFGRSGRYSAVLLDEHAFWPFAGKPQWASVASSCKSCICFSSVFGRQTKQYQLRMTASMPVLVMKWQEHEWKDDRWYAGQSLNMQPHEIAQEIDRDYGASETGQKLAEYEETIHVITWDEFADFFGEIARDKEGRPRLPSTWQIGVGQDVGETVGHPTATAWIARPAKRNALSECLFIYREHVRPEWPNLPKDWKPPTARRLATDIHALELPWDERHRVEMRRMSPDGAEIRKSYNGSSDAKERLPQHLITQWGAWNSLHQYGLAQFRNGLEVDWSKAHPFRKYPKGTLIGGVDVSGRPLDGCPRLFLIVANGQGELHLDADGDLKVREGIDEGGLVRLRAEIPAYRNRTNAQGDEVQGTPKIFDDMVDAVRGILSAFGPTAAPLTTEERAFVALKDRGQLVTLDDLAEVDDLAASAKVFTYMQNLNDEMARQKKSEGGVVNPRLKHQVR